MRTIYLVALMKPDKAVRDNIVTMYTNHHYPISDTVLLISDDDKDKAAAIKAQIGISVGDDKPSGIVTRIDTDFSGVLPSTAIDWWNDELGIH